MKKWILIDDSSGIYGKIPVQIAKHVTESQVKVVAM